MLSNVKNGREFEWFGLSSISEFKQNFSIGTTDDLFHFHFQRKT